MLALTEKQLGQALFYAIKREDFDHAEYLLSLDAPVATSHFLTQDRIAYTPSTAHHMQTSSPAGLRPPSNASASPMPVRSKFSAFWRFSLGRAVIGVATASLRTRTTVLSLKF
jgi:hypothetical protein